ncbi:hypothetical protein V6E43_25055, partial [Enterobacter hormaechei]
ESGKTDNQSSGIMASMSHILITWIPIFTSMFQAIMRRDGCVVRQKRRDLQRTLQRFLAFTVKRKFKCGAYSEMQGRDKKSTLRCFL